MAQRQENSVGAFVGGAVVGALGVGGAIYAMSHKKGQIGDLKYSIEEGYRRSYLVNVEDDKGGYTRLEFDDIDESGASPGQIERQFLKWLKTNEEVLRTSLKKRGILKMQGRMSNPVDTRKLKSKLLR